MGQLDHLTKAEREALKARALADIETTTDEEDAAIHTAALSDPDNLPLSAKKRGRVPSDVEAVAIRARAKEAQTNLIRRGRPRAAVTKEIINIRLDRDLVERLKADGAGWQTRVNDMLRKAVGI
jgi:uncharacterized protein (DUF4415 family)